MKNNLKKVISAVLSMSLGMSCLVGLNTTASAATFSDVADTASYAEAVNVLASLGVIAGYEDGTFLPTNNITRAEVTTMVVAALNMSEDAQASAGVSKFADVNSEASWATGYVNVGVAQGFIAGMTDTEFAPQDNVTYAQIVKMLVCCMGYGDYAAVNGGWPNGYLSAASSAGILSGVSASANDTVTRAQVAQLIWNALQKPLLGVSEFTTTGTTLVKLDGKDDRDFETLLSKYFDAYVMNIEVTETSKSGNLDAGKINMNVTTADWDPEYEDQIKSSYGISHDDVSVGNTAAEDYLFSSAKVVAIYDEDEEFTLAYFAPTSKVATKTVDGTLVDDGSQEDEYLYIFKSSTSSTTSRYKLTDDCKLYVNGVEYCDFAGNQDTVYKFMNASVGDTILVEDTDNSGYYDKIMVDYYAVAKVTSSSYKNEKLTLSVNSANYITGITDTKATKIEIEESDLEDGDITLSISKDGAECEITDLVEDDVVAIKFNVTGACGDSTFYEILASSETVTGKFSSKDSDDETFTIGGTEYKAVNYASFEGEVEIGNEYTVYVDAFGRLFSSEEEETSKKYAIVEKYVDANDSSNSSDYSYITVMTQEGSSKTLYLESSCKFTGASTSDIADYFGNGGDGHKSNLPNIYDENTGDSRIVEYTLKTSTGRVKEIKVVDAKVITDDFKASSDKIGNVAISSGAYILDATEYVDTLLTGDYATGSLSSFVDGTEYTALAVNKNSNSEYTFIIVLAAGQDYGSSTNFAVVRKACDGTAEVDDEEVNVLEVLYEGEEVSLNVDTAATVYQAGSYVDIDDIVRGSVIVFTTDGDGLVDQIDVIFTPDDYEDINSKLYTNGMDAFCKLPANGTIAADTWEVAFDTTVGADEPIQLVFAPVYKKGSSTVTVGAIDKNDAGYYYTSEDADMTYDFTVASGAYIYEWDTTNSKIGAFATDGSFRGLSTSSTYDVNDTNDGDIWVGIGADNYDENDGYNINEDVQYAFLMIVDETVTNAFVLNN